MFFALLLVTFVLAAVVSFCVVKVFDKPISAIFRRIIQDEISSAWHKYVKFAAYVVGISGGVRIHQLERYISAPAKDSQILELNDKRWILEVYRTIIETLQAIAWNLVYLVVIYICRLISIRHSIKAFELRSAGKKNNWSLMRFITYNNSCQPIKQKRRQVQNQQSPPCGD